MYIIHTTVGVDRVILEESTPIRMEMWLIIRWRWLVRMNFYWFAVTFQSVEVDSIHGSKITTSHSITATSHCRGQAFRSVPFPWYMPRMHSPTCWGVGERWVIWPDDFFFFHTSEKLWHPWTFKCARVFVICAVVSGSLNSYILSHLNSCSSGFPYISDFPLYQCIPRSSECTWNFSQCS